MQPSLFLIYILSVYGPIIPMHRQHIPEVQRSQYFRCKLKVNLENICTCFTLASIMIF